MTGTSRFSHSKVDSYGFEQGEDFDQKAYDEFMSSYFRVLARRASRWRPLVVGKESVSKSRKMKRFCRKGIPSEHRPLIWMEMSGAAHRMKEQPGLYKQLLSRQLDDSVTESIVLDMHRTFPENIYFVHVQDPAGLQRPLKNVLSAFAMNNPHIGYCQGLNFVAGLMLIILRNEEKAFWLLDTITRTHLPDYYASDMVAIKSEQELLGDIVRWKLPDLYNHLDSMGLQWCLVGMKWFICLYADVLPVETVLRIWDCLFYEGSKILLRVALTMIIQHEDRLLKTSNFGEAIQIFKSMEKDNVVLNCHSFVLSIFTNTGSMPRARIRKMREECTRRVLAASA